MSAPVECYQQLQEFLAPYEELRWMHEINTTQYHSAYCTLTACANNELQSLTKQKVLTLQYGYHSIHVFCNRII